MTTTEPPTPGEDWRARILGEVFDIARHCCPYGAGAVRPGAEGYTCPHHGWQQVAKTRPEGATTEPSLTLGETVWVEAVAARNASGDVLDLQEPSGGVYARVHPAEVRWRRRMPDDTAAEPVLRTRDAFAVVGGEGREILRVQPARGSWETPKVAEIVSTINDDAKDCIHVTAIEADDARGIAEALLTLAGVALNLAPLAAGVPVGSLPGEPGPGAYLIGDLLAVRFPQDTDDSRWAVQGGIDHDWLTWLAVRERYGDRPMRRLLPHTQTTTATLEITGEPLTLDAIKAALREALDQPQEALMALYDAAGAPPFAEYAEVADAIRETTSANIELRIDRDRARKDLEANKAGWAAEIERTKRLEDLRRDVVMAMCLEDGDEERTDEQIVARVRQLVSSDMGAAQEIAAREHTISGLEAESVRLWQALANDRGAWADLGRLIDGLRGRSLVGPAYVRDPVGVVLEALDRLVTKCDEARRELNDVRTAYDADLRSATDQHAAACAERNEARRERDAAIGEAARLRHERDWHLAARATLRTQIRQVIDGDAVSTEPAQSPGDGE